MTITNLVVKDLGDIVEAEYYVGTTHIKTSFPKSCLSFYVWAAEPDGHFEISALHSVVESYLKQNLK